MISLAHGAGGELMEKLIEEHISQRFPQHRGEVTLSDLDDSSVIDGIFFTTDTYTVAPIFFGKKDIGTLAISGTVNDLLATGAEPLALSLGLVIEEGFPITDLDRVMTSVSATAEKGEVQIITGDTKVVERGGVKNMIINTSGIGRRSPLLDGNFDVVKKFRGFKSDYLLDSNVKPGDQIILSGPIADHGIAIISYREGYGFESDVESDCAPLNGIVNSALRVGGIVDMKDPTRGGIANCLNEISRRSKVSLIINEDRVPLNNPTKAACDMLGLDPLEIGNEGKMILCVVKEKAEEVLSAIRKTENGKKASIIGMAEKGNKVIMETKTGGKRIIDKPYGDPIPRIC